MQLFQRERSLASFSTAIVSTNGHGPSTRKARQLLALPVGSMTSNDWSVAERIFFWCIQQHKKEGVWMAWRLMDRFIEEEKLIKTKKPRVTTYWLFRLVDAWRIESQQDGHATITPKQVLASLDEYAPIVFPDTRIYSILVDTFTKTTADPAEAPKFAEIMLERTKCECRTNPKLTPDTVMYTSVIDAWSSSGLFEAPERAEALLKEMLASPVRQVEPTAIVVTTVLNAWANRGTLDAAERAEAILNRVIELYEGGNIHMKPDAQCYGTVIAAFAKAGQGSSAESVLHRLQVLYRTTGDRSVKPNTVNFNSVISAWQNGGDPARAESVLRGMQREYKSGGDVKPDIVSYNTLISAWANSRDPDAAPRAEAILNEMIQLYDAGDLDVRPDIVSFSSVVAAWSKSSDVSAAKRAEEILQRMQDLYEAGKSNVKPNVFTFSSVVAAWSKSRDPTAPQRAESILRWMKELHRTGDEDVKPNTVTFSSFISAWAKSRNVRAGQKAEAILREMQELYRAGNSDVKPNTMTYASVIHAYANSRDAHKAESILQEMQQLQARGCEKDVYPNTICYNSVIAAWARSGHHEAGQRALAHLEHMKQLQAQGHDDCKPTIITYNTVINALSKMRSLTAVAKAHDLLMEAHELADGGNRAVQPNDRTYYTLLKAIALSPMPDKANRAERLLKEMKERSLEPSIFALNEVLHSCTYIPPDEEERSSALRIAQDSFQVISKSTTMNPMAITYVYYFRSCANSTAGSNERRDAIETGYRQCCENGFEKNSQIKEALEQLNEIRP
jgi:pentatricopeptide repeat protein